MLPYALEADIHSFPSPPPPLQKRVERAREGEEREKGERERRERMESCSCCRQQQNRLYLEQFLLELQLELVVQLLLHSSFRSPCQLFLPSPAIHPSHFLCLLSLSPYFSAYFFTLLNRSGLRKAQLAFLLPSTTATGGLSLSLSLSLSLLSLRSPPSDST